MEGPDLYVGRRLSFDGQRCTVRYSGPVEGTKGLWIGVEWDDSTRGKHNGYHNGRQVFKCLSKSPNCASFVRPNRKADHERTVLEAIRHKYDASDASTDTIIISGKIAEEVGFDKIARAQAQFKELRIVLIDQLVVSGLASETSNLLHAQQELKATCPNIVELDLGYNVIEEWNIVTDICAALPNLTSLRLGGLRLRNEIKYTAPLLKVKELHLEECLLSNEQSLQVLADPDQLPSLEILYLSNNELLQLPTRTDNRPLSTRLKTLVLENNTFEDLTCMKAISINFPGVSFVSLQGNKISSTGLDSFGQAFPQITSLNISDNNILSWDFVNSLPTLFPNLLSLRLTNNPVYRLAEDELQDPRASDKLFYLTLARIPSLTSLNHSSISNKDRSEGEIYYLSLAEQEIRALLSSSDPSTATEALSIAKRLHPQYHTLALKYGRDSILDQSENDRSGTSFHIKRPKYLPGSLGARLIKATFYLADSDSSSIAITLPSTLAVSQVMGLLLRHSVFKHKLQPLNFSMIYESEELDPVDTTAESTTRSATWGKKLTAEQKQNLWQEWGDWDADPLIRKDQNDESTVSEPVEARTEKWIQDGIVLLKDGKKWKRRVVSIPPSLKRSWGDFLDGAEDVHIRLQMA